MQRTVSTRSLCLDSPVVEALPPPKEVGQKQGPMKIRPPSDVRQIVGFNPTVPLGNEEHKKSSRADLPHVKLIGFSKSARPSSGLESLMYTPRLSESTTQQGGVGLFSDLDEFVQSSKKDFLPKHECVHFGTTVQRVHGVLLIPLSDHQHSTSCRNNPKQSHPMPIFQSSKLQNRLFSQVQEQKRCQNQLPYDGLVRRRHGGYETPLCLGNALTLRPNSFMSVRECILDNEADKHDFCSMLNSLPDQRECAYTANFVAMDFMKACFLCKRKLRQGLDIYMYRGDRAFCSPDCRHHQIVLDERAERREKCSSSAHYKYRSRISASSTITAA
ncbi:hypothetical protein O6H91_Y316500 [Diphasiastrum complanatum]|nr:hypothetical protein O6H91_Y316500 [Diphasiastrum complanatum]